MDGRDLICDRLLDEAGWLRQCAGWLTHLHTKGFPSAVNLGGSQDKPERGNALVRGVLSGTATCLLTSEPSGHSAEDSQPGPAAELKTGCAEAQAARSTAVKSTSFSTGLNASGWCVSSSMA